MSRAREEKSLSGEVLKAISNRDLIQHIGSSNEYTAMGAITEATERADPTILPAVIEASQSADEWVSAHAAQSLGLLAKLLNGSGKEHRPAAVAALTQLLKGKAPGIEDLPFEIDGESDPMAAYAGASMLRELDDIRFEAARSLGLIADPAGMAILIDRLKDEGEHSKTRIASVNALGLIGQAVRDSAEAISEALNAWLATPPATLPGPGNDRRVELELREMAHAVLALLDDA